MNEEVCEYNCSEMYNCCDCGNRDDKDFTCCPYCWSCNACDICLGNTYE